MDQQPAPAPVATPPIVTTQPLITPEPIVVHKVEAQPDEFGWFDPLFDPAHAAVLRFLTVLLALGIAVVLYLWVPDPGWRVLAAGLGAASIAALEQYIKVNA